MKRHSRQSGQSLIEVTVGIVVFMSIILAIVDLAVILLAVQANDAVCRNAARAAAAGDPATAMNRAAAVVEGSARHTAPLVSDSKIVGKVEVTVSDQPQVQLDTLSGAVVNPGGPVSGNVVVTTEVEVHPMIVTRIVSRKNLMFQAHQSFPITFVMNASKHFPSADAADDKSWQPI